MLHQENIEKLKKALEDRIVGQVKPGFSCCCGTITGPEARAVRVRPAGDYVDRTGVQCEYQVDLPYLWIVDMDANYSRGLDHFLPDAEIAQLFEEHRPLFTPDLP